MRGESLGVYVCLLHIKVTDFDRPIVRLFIAHIRDVRTSDQGLVSFGDRHRFFDK